MSPFDFLAEKRIREAQARGEFDDLPGAGQPLDLGDDRLVPEDLRVAYRMLRNAGFVPPELEIHYEMRSVERLLEQVTGEEERAPLVRRLGLLLARAGALRHSPCVDEAYVGRLGARLEARRNERRTRR